MPENWKVQNSALSTSSNDSTNNLEDAMRNLNIQANGNHNGVVAHSSSYPDRPGEPDCIYYLRTGMCGYGSNCRFNHPTYAGQVAQYRGELPERVGQPDCLFYLKTGTCKFGSTCKYHHPRDRHNGGQISLNILGLPMRQEEKPCPFYMRTWSCKFGSACKFHHPQPPTLGTVLPVTGPATYGSTTGSSAAPLSSLPYLSGVPALSLPRAPSMSGPPMQSPHAYMPFVLSPSQGILPAQQGWSTYMVKLWSLVPFYFSVTKKLLSVAGSYAILMSVLGYDDRVKGTLNPVSSTASHFLGANVVYNSKDQGESGSSGQVHLLSTSVSHYPERPEEQECHYYMKTGTCKFGSTCKYHHPKERIASLTTSSLGPIGLPLRPGQAICTFYSMYGICKYGSNCKFDHPWTGFYNYGVSMPTLSIPDTSFFPYQRNSPITQSSETSPSKSSMLPDQMKPEATSTKHQNPDTKASQEQEEATTPTHTTSSECPHDQ